VIDGHDHDNQAAQHVDGRQAIAALIGCNIQGGLPTLFLWQTILKPARLWGKCTPVKTTIYGIKNCDTMKKARTWLESHGIEYDFHDYKVSGIEATKLVGWLKVVGWETLLNRAGTTFRKLPDRAKQNLDEAKAIKLMLEQPSMIKRPVLERGKTTLVGFSPDKYATLR